MDEAFVKWSTVAVDHLPQQVTHSRPAASITISYTGGSLGRECYGPLTTLCELLTNRKSIYGRKFKAFPPLPTKTDSTPFGLMEDIVREPPAKLAILEDVGMDVSRITINHE